MIQEITNFVDELKPEIFSKNLELSEGLYLLVDTNQDGEVLSRVVISYSKKEEPEPIHFKLLEWITNSTPVSPNKSFDSRKKIFNQLCSPYAIGFKKKIFEKNLREDGDEKYKDIDDSLDLYFRTAEEYLDGEDEEFEIFRSFCQKNLIPLIEGLDEYKDLKSTSCVYILKKDAEIEKQIEFYQRYLREKVFNKEEYNKETEEGVFGISDSVSGFNRKKTFLQHQTAPLDLNYRVSGDQAVNLWKFFRLWKNRQIPNPFPLFIDKQELNGEVVSIFNEDRRFGYAEIITKLIEKYDEEYLSNYYLLFFQSGLSGSKIPVADIDFVPVFKYKIDQNLKIEEIINLGGKIETKIQNVFKLEEKVISKIFEEALVYKGKNSFKKIRYFFDFFAKNNKEAKRIRNDLAGRETLNDILKYRKAFYDYIYKSKRQAVTKKMFDTIMKNGILADIRQDRIEKDGRNKKKDHTKEFQIKEKLNIWFSLYNFFDLDNPNPDDMIETTKQLKQLVLSIATEKGGGISEANAENDKIFAFASGQVIYKILIQSKSSNRSHALLEPFLQKVDPSLFKAAIARSFDMYKHEFTLYPQKYEFDRLMGEVMGYAPVEKNMKKLMPFILAGYFSESIFNLKNNEDAS